MMKFSVFLIVGAAVLLGNAAAASSYSEIEELEKLVEERLEKLKELNKNIENATKYYDEMALERIDSLNYVHHTISVALEKTNKDAVYKGLNNNRPFSNFECLVKAADQAAIKIKNAHEKFPTSATEIKDKSAATVEPFLLIVKNLDVYAIDLLESKKKEISQTNDPNLKKKILREVADILKFVDGVLAEIEKKIFKVKYGFFEEFVHLCYNTETVYKKVQREDFPKILNCV